MKAKFLQVLYGVFIVVIIAPAEYDEPAVFDQLNLTGITQYVLCVDVYTEYISDQCMTHGHWYTLASRVMIHWILGGDTLS